MDKKWRRKETMKMKIGATKQVLKAKHKKIYGKRR